MNKDKIINEFKIKINGEWYHSVLYERSNGEQYVERTKLNNGKVSNESKNPKSIC